MTALAAVGLFQPKGPTAEWSMVYAVLPREEDKLVTYEQLDAALGRELRANRTPLYRAAQELLQEHCLALESVRKIGYRTVLASEHVRLARKDQRSARRKMTKAVAKISNVNVRGLTQDQRDELQVYGHAIRALANAHRRLARRQDILEARVDRVENAAAAFPSPNDFDHLRRRLETLEREKQEREQGE